MAKQRVDTPRRSERHFENEPADEWQEAYGRGGPVRSDEPERDYFFEQSAAPAVAAKRAPSPERERAERMSWRAAGAQDYPNADSSTDNGGVLAQSHRGKGPKGYRPSDERLRENVCERLTHDPFVDATDIEVSVANGVLTLTGRVATRRMQYAVADLLAEIPGVGTVHNSVQVSGGDEPAS